MDDADCAVRVIGPKQPYLDWIRSVENPPPQVTLETLRRDRVAYIIPPVESAEDETRAIRRCHARVFEDELRSWYLDESTWPKRRGLQTFMKWFDVTIHPVVVYLTD